jgi:hypothetical protein
MKTRITAIILAVIAIFISTSSTFALELPENEVLSLGDEGVLVTELQECLLDKGFILPKFGADGQLRNETRSAIVVFQVNNDLAVDGVVGPQTVTALDCASVVEELDESEVELEEGEPEEPTVDDLLTIDQTTVSYDTNVAIVTVEGTHSVCSEIIRGSYTIDEEGVYQLTLTTDTVKDIELCDTPEETVVYQHDLVIDTGLLEVGDYSYVVNEQQEGVFTITPRIDSDLRESQVTNNTSVKEVSLNDDGTLDAVEFAFKMNLNALDDPLFVPMNADAAGDIEIIDRNQEDESFIDINDTNPRYILESQAPVVVGTDGNEYYRVDDTESFTYRVVVSLDAGSYQGQLQSISFTSRRVTSPDYEGFIGLNLELDPDQWTTRVIELN